MGQTHPQSNRSKFWTRWPGSNSDVPVLRGSIYATDGSVIKGMKCWAEQTDSFEIERLLLCGKISSHDRRQSCDAGDSASPAAGTCPGAGPLLPARRLGPHRLDRQDPAPLLGQLGARLRVRVEQREVWDDDRDRKCYREYAGERAERADKHAEVGPRRHVAVADRRHGHDRPPQSNRDGVHRGTRACSL